MQTLRHNYDLFYGCTNKLIIAPRYFEIGGNTYFIHVNESAEYVYIFSKVSNLTKTNMLVDYFGTYKIYSCKKGLCFVFPYLLDDYTKKYVRVYLCD